MPAEAILEFLINKQFKVRDPFWSLRLGGDIERACAFALVSSREAAEQDIKLLNPDEDLVNPEHAPMFARLKDGTDAEISYLPSGEFCMVADNLLMHEASAKEMKLDTSGGVLVGGEPTKWRVVRPPRLSFLEPNLSFSKTAIRSHDQSYRNRVALIAKPDAPLKFGIATETEGWGDDSMASTYLIDRETASRIFFEGKTVLGDIELEPIFSYSSPEATLVQMLTERINQLIPDFYLG